MTLFLDITDQAAVALKLEKLTSETPPRFGIMTAQHMVEHLELLLRASNGKDFMKLEYRQEKAEKIKAVCIGTDNELPIGFRAPILPVGETLPLKYNNLDMAKENLYKELGDYILFFKQNPNAMPVNPTMGALSATEWNKFHNKHFTHHFKQFGLM